jgi:hypothetical protein
MKFDFFKKKEKEMLDVPKNLPELAKDVIEPTSGDVPAVQKKDSAVQEIPEQKKPDEYKIPAVPVSSGVPRLDLNLIRSANIHLPDMPQRQEQQPQLSQQLPQEQSIQSPQSMPPIYRENREPINIINLPRVSLSENGGAQRNVYINKGKALFDDLESAIASNRTDLAKNIISNILPLLYEYHDIDSMNDSDRLRELKDLEKFWAMLQRRNYAVKTMIDSIESDILRKSGGLLENNDTSMKIISNQIISNQIVSSQMSSASSSAPSPSGFQPVFVPIIKSSSSSPDYVAPIYVQPYERFYFKDGKIASSLKDLYYILNDISDDTFYHHVSVERNDFSNWIKDVLKDYSLAKDISNIYGRRDLLEFLKGKI